MILKQTTKIESCIQTMTQLSFNSKPISLVTPIHQWPLDGQSTLMFRGHVPKHQVPLRYGYSHVTLAQRSGICQKPDRAQCSLVLNLTSRSSQCIWLTNTKPYPTPNIQLS